LKELNYPGPVFINMTSHPITWSDRKKLPCHEADPARVDFDDNVTRDLTGIKLLRRNPVISPGEIRRIYHELEVACADFAIVSLPVMLAARGTELEGRVVSGVPVSLRKMKEKVISRRKFSW